MSPVAGSRSLTVLDAEGTTGSSLQFSCHRCGECCRAWTVPVERAHIEARFRGVPWIEARSKERKAAGLGPLLPPVRSGLCRLDTSNGPRLDCVFLAADGACELHAREGETTKPPPCRQFPFQLSRRGGALHVALDPACKAVLVGGGEPVDSTKIEEMAQWGHVEEERPVTQLRPGRPVTEEDARAVVDEIVRSLRSDGAIDARLRRAHALSLGVDAQTPRTDPLGRRLLLTLVLLLFRNAWQQRSIRGRWAPLRRVVQLLRFGLGSLVGGGVLPIEARGITVIVGEVDAMRFDLAASETHAVFERWLRDFPERTQWGPTLSRTVGQLLVTFTMARFFMLAVSSAAGRAPTEADAISGITLAEKVAGARLPTTLVPGSVVADAWNTLLDNERLADWAALRP